MKILGITVTEKLSVSAHVSNILGSCSSSIYALKTLRLRGIPTPALHEVARVTMMARLTYASPAWWGYLTAEDRDGIDRFYQRAIRGGFLPSDAPIVDALAQRADDALFGAIIRDRSHVFRHLCQERPMIRYGLRARPHPFALPIKDNRNFISRLIYKNIYQSPLFCLRPTYNKLAVLTHTHGLFTLVRLTCSICCVLSAMFSSNKTKIQYNTVPIINTYGGSMGGFLVYIMWWQFVRAHKYGSGEGKAIHQI